MSTSQLRLGTFNLQNLQLPGHPLYSGSSAIGAADYGRRIEWLGGIVRRMRADVIGFQELWSPRCLVDVFEKAGLADDYTLFTKGASDSIGKGIQVAAAVRNECAVGSNPRWVEKFPEGVVMKKRKASAPEPNYEMSVNIKTFSRPVLVLEVKPAKGKAFDFYVAHLKSKLPMRLDAQEAAVPGVKENATAIGAALSTIRRTAEACALRALFHAKLKNGGRPVVVVGDLNDAPNSMTGSILSADPAFRLFQRGRAGNSASGLYSAGMLQDLRSFRDVVYTYVHEGKLESLDHVYVSQHFYDYSKKRIWSFRSMTVINDHLDEIDDEVLRRLYSDHAAVVATFDHYPAAGAGGPGDNGGDDE